MKTSFCHSHSMITKDNSSRALAGRITCEFVVNLIQDLNSQLLQDLDTDPNFSRSESHPAMHAALRTGSVDSAIIIGGSNAGQLADCCTTLGLVVVKHVRPRKMFQSSFRGSTTPPILERQKTGAWPPSASACQRTRDTMQ